MGEHAVVYGRPALIAAVDLRLTVHLDVLSSVAPTQVRLDLPALGFLADAPWSAVREYARRAREDWASYNERPSRERFRDLRGDDPLHVVKVALGEAMEPLGEAAPGGGHLRILSDLPIGSGFGSSAATAVGVVAAYLAWRSAPLDRERIERLALEAERRQHGLPSGVDARNGAAGWIPVGTQDRRRPEHRGHRAPLSPPLPAAGLRYGSASGVHRRGRRRRAQPSR